MQSIRDDSSGIGFAKQCGSTNMCEFECCSQTTLNACSEALAGEIEIQLRFIGGKWHMVSFNGPLSQMHIIDKLASQNILNVRS